ncbi:MAG TPA: hypothetical protein VE549_01075 [Myxococcaceae bacterium]|jgi:hypothetical protein|nr:hypothetical protein [Myxococcaceae bacterium]
MVGARSLGLALVLAWQALAGGIGTLLHTCSMSAEMAVAACKCRHAKGAASAADQLRRTDCCTQELVRAEIAPAVRDSVRGLETLSVPALAAPALAPPDASALPAQVLAWRTSPPGQGPPVFLKIRTLLI